MIKQTPCGSPMQMMARNLSKGPNCWKGYERVPGTKKLSKGSCRKK